MSDIFHPEDVANLLSGKRIAYLGDSVMRGLYKDLVWLLNDATLIPKKMLGAKGEKNFPETKNFSVWKGGPPDTRLMDVFHENNVDDLMPDYKGLTAGRTYVEGREYYSEKHEVSITYKFITRVWSAALEEWLKSYVEKKGAWDIIVFNSCLWDVLRWGPYGTAEFKQNLPKLLELIPNILAPQGIFIWLTTPPCSEEIKSNGMNVPAMAFKWFSTRFEVIEANFFTAQKVAEAGFNVLDMHYYLQMQTFRRNADGLHWSPEANRLITNMTLTHVSLANGVTLPKRVKSNYSLELTKLRAKSAMQECNSEKIQEERMELLAFAKRLAAEKNKSDKHEQQEIKKNALRKAKEMKDQAAEMSKINKFIMNNPEYQQSNDEEDKYCHEEQNSNEIDDEDSDEYQKNDENDLAWYTINIWDMNKNSDEESDGITFVAVINNKDNEKDIKEWGQELIKLINSNKQHKIKQKYYDRAVCAWKLGTDFAIPEISEVEPPRIFKGKNGDLVDFDTPDEYIDNNHPAWQEHMDLYTQEEIAKSIHKKWGSSIKIELTRNLTSFPNETPDLSQGNIQNSQANGSPDHNQVEGYAKMGKQKRSSFDKSNDASVAKIRKVDYIDEVSAASPCRSGGLEQTTGILGSVAEVFKFNQMYHQGDDNDPWLTEEQAQELNSLEDLYGIFELQYSS